MVVLPGKDIPKLSGKAIVGGNIFLVFPNVALGLSGIVVLDAHGGTGAGGGGGGGGDCGYGGNIGINDIILYKTQK